MGREGERKLGKTSGSICRPLTTNARIGRRLRAARRLLASICLLGRLGRDGAFAAAAAGGFVVSAAENAPDKEKRDCDNDNESGDALPICGEHSGQ